MSKTVTDNQRNGELGETKVKARVLELGHVFEGRGRLETGIDGTIEFRDPATGRMTGRTVAVQVKTRVDRAYDGETDTGFRYLMRPEDVAYWRQSSLPVVLVLLRLSDNSFYWKDVADCVAGNERLLEFDKAVDRLDEGAMDRLAALSVRRGRMGVFVPPMRTGERAHLNLLRIDMPEEIYVGESPFASGRQAVPHLLATDERRFDWVIRDRRFVSFRDPRGTGMEAIVDPDTVHAVDTELVSDTDDHEDEIVMIELLRRTMDEQFSNDLAWEKNARAFFFRAIERFAPRRYEYRSLRDPTSAMVVQVYMDKKKTEVVRSVRHHAFSPRFERIGSDWFLSISPTFVFTEDGFKPHRFAADLLAGKKRLDRNGSIRGQFFLFRFLLSGGTLAPMPEADLFGSPPPLPSGPDRVLGFEPIDAIEMDVAVPEDAWAKEDPNAAAMRTESDEGLFAVGRTA